MESACNFFPSQSEQRRPSFLEEAKRSHLVPKNTFDTFMMPANKLFQFRLEASRYKRDYPLFIIGEKGCGKTHLIQAIGDEELRSGLNQSVFYLDLDHLSIYSLAQARIAQLLLIDNVDASSGTLKALINERIKKRKRTVIAIESEEQISDLKLQMIPDKKLHLKLISPVFLLGKNTGDFYIC